MKMTLTQILTLAEEYNSLTAQINELQQAINVLENPYSTATITTNASYQTEQKIDVDPAAAIQFLEDLKLVKVLERQCKERDLLGEE